MNKPPRIDQFLPYFDESSLVTKTALDLQNYFRSLGYYSEIFFVAKSKKSRTTSVHEFSTFDNFYEAFGVGIYHHYQHNYIMDRLLSFQLYRVNVLHARLPSEKYSNFAKNDETESRLLKDTIQSERYLKKLEILGHKNWILDPSMQAQLTSLQWGKEATTLKERNILALELIGAGKSDPLQKLSEQSEWKVFKDDYLNILSEGEGFSFQQIHLVIMVLALLKKNCQQQKIRVLFIGKINKGYASRIMALCKQLQLSVATSLEEKYFQKANVIFLPEASDVERRQLYSEASVFLNLSSYSEDPRPSFLARSMGIPLIAWDNPQNRDLFGTEGVLFIPEEDVPGVVEAVMAYIQQQEFKSSLLASAIKRKQVLSEARLSDALQSAVTEMLDGFSAFRSSHL